MVSLHPRPFKPGNLGPGTMHLPSEVLSWSWHAIRLRTVPGSPGFLLCPQHHFLREHRRHELTPSSCCLLGLGWGTCVLIAMPLPSLPALSSLAGLSLQLKWNSSRSWKQFPTVEFSSPSTWTHIQPYHAAGPLWLPWLVGISECLCSESGSGEASGHDGLGLSRPRTSGSRAA